ncbi:MAG: glycosyltransferase family 2 protein [bacterium]|nr:glycosyltransferase family 2 protein [bacterium]
MTFKPDLSVLIVNWNGAQFLKGCLDSLLNQTWRHTIEIILIDNQSSDDSLRILAPYNDKITLIAHNENAGFARGNNLCLPHATGKYLLLLNNDTIVKPGALDTLLDFFEATPDCGALSPQLLNADGSIQTQGSALGAWRFKSKTPRTLPFICGAALITTREFYTSIGGLDENLFFYNEDIDFCTQVKKSGKKVYYLPSAQITHFGGGSTKFRKVGAIYDGTRGSLYLSWKSYPIMVHYLFRVLVLIDALIRTLVFAILGACHQKARPYLHTYLRIIRMIFNGEFKPQKGNHATQN